jgi:hypothetical protein
MTGGRRWTATGSSHPQVGGQRRRFALGLLENDCSTNAEMGSATAEIKGTLYRARPGGRTHGNEFMRQKRRFVLSARHHGNSIQAARD